MSSLRSLLFLSLFSLLQYHASLALALPATTTTTTTDNDILAPSLNTPNDPNFDLNNPVLNSNYKPNVTEFSTTDHLLDDVTLICPSPRAPQFGSTSGAWKVLNHLKTLDNNGPPLPGAFEHADGCRRMMGCEEGLGVFWCVGDADG
ncbi:uncharacterized protein B0T23DRAFT_454760 [Neurospora hispaniola]|uniref:Uncharacterized protein n=1 Tax=Neurospora hispaniola TaxID=588809 RepID=A0AAJ0MQR6_9PEZI|nr:hypothetical protein B0T23DRAFT_454760 [Neurospora hispaniola]